jgi:hypothetical protein
VKTTTKSFIPNKFTVDMCASRSSMLKPNVPYTFTLTNEGGTEMVLNCLPYYRKNIGNEMVRIFIKHLQEGEK